MQCDRFGETLEVVQTPAHVVVGADARDGDDLNGLRRQIRCCCCHGLSSVTLLMSDVARGAGRDRRCCTGAGRHEGVKCWRRSEVADRVGCT